jgi:hypothetical protein
MGKIRFILACPLLIAGIGLVLAGRVLMTKDDRDGFDRVYFGNQRPHR